MKANELKKGNLYGDADGVNMVIYIGKDGFLYDFVTAEYDEARGDYKKTDDTRRLTVREVEKLIEW